MCRDTERVYFGSGFWLALGTVLGFVILFLYSINVGTLPVRLGIEGGLYFFFIGVLFGLNYLLMIASSSLPIFFLISLLSLLPSSGREYIHLKKYMLLNNESLGWPARAGISFILFLFSISLIKVFYSEYALEYSLLILTSYFVVLMVYKVLFEDGGDKYKLIMTIVLLASPLVLLATPQLQKTEVTKNIFGIAFEKLGFSVKCAKAVVSNPVFVHEYRSCGLVSMINDKEYLEIKGVRVLWRNMGDTHVIKFKCKEKFFKNNILNSEIEIFEEVESK